MLRPLRKFSKSASREVVIVALLGEVDRSSIGDVQRTDTYEHNLAYKQFVLNLLVSMPLQRWVEMMLQSPDSSCLTNLEML